MRDAGYRDAAAALAELIDNSIQAGATDVELLTVENDVKLSSGALSARLKHIAILDNGSGMDATTLEMALQYGNGRFRDDPDGIGRFGMGLPTSSLSQAKRVDVWSWQDGPDNALHSYLDLDEIKSGDLSKVPSPEPQPLPELWKNIGGSTGRSGTLVVWSDLDRCRWVTSEAVIRNTEEQVGRTYRYFIAAGEVSIRLVGVHEKDQQHRTIDKLARPNDPLYLMAPSSTPEPFSDKPMFVEFGKPWQVDVIDQSGESTKIEVRLSFASDESRAGSNPGNKKHGQHAARNRGISLVRARRELVLEKSFRIDDYRDRWWGCEISFPPSLDHIFGVTHTKQDATNFESAVEIAIELENTRGSEGTKALMEELKEIGDERAVLVQLIRDVRAKLQVISGQLREQTSNSRKKGESYDRHSAETRATETANEREEKGFTASSTGQKLEESEMVDVVSEMYEEDGYSAQEARKQAEIFVSRDVRFDFRAKELSGSQIFEVITRGDALFVAINSASPVFANLIEVLPDSQSLEGLERDQLAQRLESAREGLKLLFYSWARLEDEAHTDLRRQYQNTRIEWGKFLFDFMEYES